MTTISEIFPLSSSEESDVPEAVKHSQEVPQAKKAKMAVTLEKSSPVNTELPPPQIPKDQPTCEECDKDFADSNLFRTFDHLVCDECKNMERDGPHELNTKTDAKKQFPLADPYAEDEESENLLAGIEETCDVENLRYQNRVMQDEINKLHDKIEYLKQENKDLKEIIWGKILPALEEMKYIATT